MHYKVEETTYAYINYWGWIKSDWDIFKIFDDDIDTLEKKILKLKNEYHLKVDLPYDKSRIAD